MSLWIHIEYLVKPFAYGTKTPLRVYLFRTIFVQKLIDLLHTHHEKYIRHNNELENEACSTYLDTELLY